MCQIHLLKHSPRVSDQEVWGGAQELAFLASSHVMLVPMPILLVTDHTMRTTATEHLRVAILNSPKKPPHRMQWNKLRIVYIYIFFYSYSLTPPLTMLADKNVVFGSSSVWAQEVCHWVNSQSLSLHICHILRKYCPRKIHQHNT